MTETSPSLAVPTQRAAPVEVAVQAFHDVWREMTLCFRDGSYQLDRGVAQARTQLPAPAFNGVWGIDAAVDADAVLAAVADFSAGDLPWNVQLRPGYPAELDAALTAAGLVTTEEVPFMVLTDPSRCQAAVDAARIGLRPAESFVDLDNVLSLLEQGFEMPAELTRHRFPIRFFTLDESTTWLAAVDARDVSTSFGAVRRGQCGVFNVATPAAERGRGYGAAVTAKTVLAAFEGGARGAYLQSSPMGFRVYERLGFATVESWRQWVPEQYAEPH